MSVYTNEALRRKAIRAYATLPKVNGVLTLDLTAPLTPRQKAERFARRMALHTKPRSIE
jgi:hypothetical protein